jgi:adenine specific DNA methylase Mod
MELTWANKDKVLYYEINEEGAFGKPRWIDKNDPLLKRPLSIKLTGTIGISNTDNRLIHGDNLLALKALIDEFKNKKDNEKVKCIYIDPPYNTGNEFSTYDDNFEHSEWLGMMNLRLKYLRELLKEDGIIIIQIDDKEHAPLEMVMNTIFNEKNKVGTIIWRRRQSQANLSGTISTIHDYILIYAKDKSKLNNPKLKSMIWADTSKYGYNQQSSEEIRDYFGAKTDFDTPKPELLIYNILGIATKKGDLVLDSFLGSGTTTAVAHKMGRKWIGIEMVKDAYSLSVKRMTRIITEKPQPKIGITEKVRWNGGGGCKFYKLIIQDVEQNQEKNS